MIDRSASDRLVLAWSRLPNKSIGFAGIKYIDFQYIDCHVFGLASDVTKEKTCVFKPKRETKAVCAKRNKGSNNSALVSLFSLPPPSS